VPELNLLDKIVDWVPNDHLLAYKALSPQEEYLRDHFPGYPVMPGVMMLEALVQSAAWLLRASTDFSRSMVTLVEARNVKYSRFLAPGQTLYTSVKLLSSEADRYSFRGEGKVEKKTVLSARFVLRYFDLAELNPALSETDKSLVEGLRETFKLLTECRE